MNITELLHTAVEIDPKNICLNISTTIDIFNLCFIEYEDENKIGVYITGEDGRERFLIINKSQIIALQVVYENDIQITKNDEDDVMIN